MAVTTRKLITVTYDMYDITDGKNVLVESVKADQPLQLITGIGMIPVPAIEEKWNSLSSDDDYEIVLTCDMAFGDYDDDAVVDIPIAQLNLDDKFADEFLRPGAWLPLQNENGERVGARVLEVSDSHIKVDCNHPFAGKDLLLRGTMIESRPATDEDVMALTMHHCGGCGGGGCHENGCGDGCGGGCGHCGDDNGHDGNCCGGGCGHCAS